MAHALKFGLPKYPEKYQDFNSSTYSEKEEQYHLSNYFASPMLSSVRNLQRLQFVSCLFCCRYTKSVYTRGAPIEVSWANTDCQFLASHIS